MRKAAGGRQHGGAAAAPVGPAGASLRQRKKQTEEEKVELVGMYFESAQAVQHQEEKDDVIELQPAAAQVAGQALHFNAASAAQNVDKEEHADSHLFPILLCKAVERGDAEEVKALSYLHTCHVADYDKRTPIHIAAAEGIRINKGQSEDILRIMVESLNDPVPALNAKDRWGRTPLLEACLHKNGMTANLIHEKGGQLGADPLKISGLLCDFAASGDAVSLKMTLSVGADPNAADYDLRTPMHVAAAAGQTKVVQALLEFGARRDPVDRWGNTPVSEAEKNGHAEILRLLTE